MKYLYLIILLLLSKFILSQRYIGSDTIDLNDDGDKEIISYDYRLNFKEFMFIEIKDNKKTYLISDYGLTCKRCSFHPIFYNNNLFKIFPRVKEYLSDSIYNSNFQKSLPSQLVWILNKIGSEKEINNNDILYSFKSESPYFNIIRESDRAIFEINPRDFKEFYEKMLPDSDKNISTSIYYNNEFVWIKKQKKEIKINDTIALLTDSFSIILNENKKNKWLFVHDDAVMAFGRYYRKDCKRSIGEILIWENYIIFSYRGLYWDAIIIDYKTGLALVLNTGNYSSTFGMSIDKNILKIKKDTSLLEFNLEKILQSPP